MGGDLGAATRAAIGIALSALPFLLALARLGADRVAGRVIAFVPGSLGGELASVLTFTWLVGVHERTRVTLLLALLSTTFFLVRGILDTAA